MRTTIITTCLILSSIMILDSLNAGHAFVMFLLAGIVPGTDIAISGSRMLEVFALLIGFTVSRVISTLLRSFYASNGTMLSAQS